MSELTRLPVIRQIVARRNDRAAAKAAPALARAVIEQLERDDLVGSFGEATGGVTNRGSHLTGEWQLGDSRKFNIRATYFRLYQDGSKSLEIVRRDRLGKQHLVDSFATGQCKRDI
jgi:hypothetical protein